MATTTTLKPGVHPAYKSADVFRAQLAKDSEAPPATNPAPPAVNAEDISFSPPAASPPAPEVDTARLVEELEAAKRDNARLQEELAADRASLEKANAAQRELDERKRLEELSGALNYDPETFSTLDPEEFKRAALPMLAAIRKFQEAEAAKVAERVEALDKKVNSRLAQADESKAAELKQLVNAAILTAVPNLKQLQALPAYKTFMSQRIGKSSKTYDQAVAEEYAAGNAEFVIDVMQTFLRSTGQPASLEHAAQVSPVRAGSQPAPGADDTTDDITFARDLNFKLQSGKITHQQFRELSAKRREERSRAATAV